MLPADLSEMFRTEFEVDKEKVITNVYQQSFPNVYLASMSRFMSKRQEHPYIKQLIEEGFQDFVDSNIKDYPDYQRLECHFVGSIAFYYQDILKAVCKKNGIKVGKILQKPIEGIYHYILEREGISD